MRELYTAEPCEHWAKTRSKKVTTTCSHIQHTKKDQLRQRMIIIKKRTKICFAFRFKINRWNEKKNLRKNGEKKVEKRREEILSGKNKKILANVCECRRLRSRNNVNVSLDFLYFVFFFVNFFPAIDVICVLNMKYDIENRCARFYGVLQLTSTEAVIALCVAHNLMQKKKPKNKKDEKKTTRAFKNLMSIALQNVALRILVCQVHFVFVFQNPLQYV